MTRKLALCLMLAYLIIAVMPNSSQAAVLWYNGDFNCVNGLANEINTDVSQANTYDDFIVPGPGWQINSLWSNNLMSFTGVQQALWEIRSGVSSGDGGTVVYSGTSPASQTATGRSGFGFEEYMILVSGLNLNLGSGTYWLTVAPLGFESGRSFVSTTSGLNAVGTPAGNNDNSFFDSIYFGYDFFPTRQVHRIESADYSMGISGSIIPEPATLSLLGFGLLGLLRFKKKQ